MILFCSYNTFIPSQQCKSRTFGLHCRVCTRVRNKAITFFGGKVDFVLIVQYIMMVLDTWVHTRDDHHSLTKHQHTPSIAMQISGFLELICDMYKGVQQSQHLFCEKVDFISLDQCVSVVLDTLRHNL